MFRYLRPLVVRGWPLLLLGWGLLAAGLWHAAPPWQQVAEDKEFGFLPARAPSIQADAMFRKAFPDDRYPSNIVIVLHRGENDRPQVAEDRKFIDDVLEPALLKIADKEGGLVGQIAPAEADEPLFGPAPDAPSVKPPQRSILARIRTPNGLGTGSLLVSADSRAMLVVVDLTTEFNSNKNWDTIAEVESLLKQLQEEHKAPAGLSLNLTGSAVLGRDNSQAELSSARATEFFTVVLVVVLLLLIYRAPLLALIPLATVFLGVKISLYLLTLMAQAGWITLFEGIQIYITILSYGAGVDYCLFLIARYEEEKRNGAKPRDAAAGAVERVGPSLTASAGTVMFGIGMMYFAEFGKFREAGIAIPLSLLFVLFATLTFSPSLLCLFGRWASWPLDNVPGPSQNEKPATTWHRLFQLGIPQGFWEAIGRALVRRPGTIWLTCVACMMPFVIVGGLFCNHLSYDMIGDLPSNAPSTAGTRVLQRHFPAGLLGSTTALLVNPDVDFGTSEGREVVRTLTECLTQRQHELGLADIRTLTVPLGITPASQAAIDVDVPGEVRQAAVKRAALAAYTTSFGERRRTGTRLEFVFRESPFSQHSIVNLERVETALGAALPANLKSNSQWYFVGTTASVRDLSHVIGGDRSRIQMLVLASVFVILILLLRRLGVVLYLLASVLFSYVATLGVAIAVFWLLDPHGFSGIDWKVAIFLFTILIAVGEDYNIFLLSRVHEEEERHGPVDGVTVALARTGPVISSCGLIMAGTFASLMAGSLTQMKQLGFALAFGVLLDTFVVRPILVPAFLILRAKALKAKFLARSASDGT